MVLKSFKKELLIVSFLSVFLVYGCSFKESTEEIASPLYPRLQGQSYLLNDGTLLIAGGYKSYVFDPSKKIHIVPNQLIPCEKFNPGQKIYKLIENCRLPARRDAASTLLKTGQVLVSGGSTDWLLDKEFSSTLLFDIHTYKYSAGPNMIAPRAGHTSILLPNDQVLLLGGHSEQGVATKYKDSTYNQYFKMAELYNARLNKFFVASYSEITGLGIGFKAVSLKDGNILIVGNKVKKAELYLWKENKFISLFNINQARLSPALIRLSDGRVLILGGTDQDDQYLDSAEIFDPVTKKFTLVGHMCIKRANPSVLLLPDGQVLIAGGTTIDYLTPPYASNQIEIFDPKHNTFYPFSSMKYYHGNTQLTYLLGHGVLISGQSPSQGKPVPSEILHKL